MIRSFRKIKAPIFTIVFASFFVTATFFSASAQEKKAPQTAGVDNTKMGAYRALAQHAFLEFQKGDTAAAAQLARSLERVWDKAEDYGGDTALKKTHPDLFEEIDKAMDDAARIIRSDPRRAAQIYLTHEPSMSLSAPLIEAVLREIKDEFGSPVYGVQVFADFMARHGELKTPPKSWKDIVAPALLNSPST